MSAPQGEPTGCLETEQVFPSFSEATSDLEIESLCSEDDPVMQVLLEDQGSSYPLPRDKEQVTADARCHMPILGQFTGNGTYQAHSTSVKRF